MNNEALKPEVKESSRKELYSAIVWMLAGLALVAYCVVGFLHIPLPGVEEFVAFLSSVEGRYIYLAAFVSIFIEGLYLIGSFFPGSTAVLILAMLSQSAGAVVFFGTILAIFAGWCLAGIANILLAKAYHSKMARMQEDEEYQIKDHAWITWFPAFRANHEVAQVTDGGNPLKIFLSSVRVKFWASLVTALCVLILSLFMDINKMSNEEGFVTAAVVAVISFVVGGIKLRDYYNPRG